MGTNNGQYVLPSVTVAVARRSSNRRALCCCVHCVVISGAEIWYPSWGRHPVHILCFADTTVRFSGVVSPLFPPLFLRCSHEEARSHGAMPVWWRTVGGGFPRLSVPAIVVIITDGIFGDMMNQLETDLNIRALCAEPIR
ncbi:hypothetical protein LSM04_000242 [Trypanosoma melophagium]|uniref:uncharacterized protein n=1 Tax=Trypanosoma melophagium TaxID=715481 RepID=UPI00351A9C23|nr:hypothetical protein LSM04_000242 [Trypanosoma melophagium]